MRGVLHGLAVDPGLHPQPDADDPRAGSTGGTTSTSRSTATGCRRWRRSARCARPGRGGRGAGGGAGDPHRAAAGHLSSATLGPDVVVAGVVRPGGFAELGRLDGRYVSTEVAGGMTGRLGGVWCARGSLVVRSFAYAGADDPQELP